MEDRQAPPQPPRRWYIVVATKPLDKNAPRLAYTNLDHAEAVRRSNDYEYPSIGPWEVVAVAE